MVHSRSELQGNSEFSVNDMLHQVANSSLVCVRVQKLRYLFHVFSTLNRERIAWINFESSYDRRSVRGFLDDDRGFRSKIVPINGGSIFTSIERCNSLRTEGNRSNIWKMSMYRSPGRVLRNFVQVAQNLWLPVSVACENYDRFRETFPKNVPQFRMFLKYNNISEEWDRDDIRVIFVPSTISYRFVEKE